MKGSTLAKLDKPLLKRGVCISFEGLDGCGKSSLIIRIIEFLEELGIPYIQTREPGGTKVAEQLRFMVLDPSNHDMHMVTDTMMYATARSSLIHSVVLPALAERKIVILDRYIDSSIAYQGYGSGQSEEFIQKIKLVNEFAASNLVPDRTYLIDIPLEESFKRTGMRAKENQTDLDRIEQRESEFHGRVYHGFHKIAEQEPERVVVVDGTQSREQVFEDVWNDFKRLLYENLK